MVIAPVKICVAAASVDSSSIVSHVLIVEFFDYKKMSKRGRDDIDLAPAADGESADNF